MNSPQPKYLFDYLDEVRRQLKYRDRVAVFLDLDGTLASITRTPKMTRIKPEARAALQSLVQDQRHYVAIVSGRGMQDLKRIVKLSEITYAGNHGLEIDGPGMAFVHGEAKERVGLIAELCAELRVRLRAIKGVHVEFKTLTASVHYRLAAASEVDRIREAIEHAIVPCREQIYMTEGKRVLELRPAVAWDKGAAVNWILSQTGHDQADAIYVGDDRTDEDAFRALPSSVTINVGATFGITPARYFVRSPEGVLAFMNYLPRIRESLRIAPDIVPVAFPASTGD
jgi:trehalose 6-phosphate phosphatase